VVRGRTDAEIARDGPIAGHWIAGLTLRTALGSVGPAVVGTVIAALALILTTAPALLVRRRS
jgi:hypothetical protein